MVVEINPSQSSVEQRLIRPPVRGRGRQARPARGSVEEDHEPRVNRFGYAVDNLDLCLVAGFGAVAPDPRRLGERGDPAGEPEGDLDVLWRERQAVEAIRVSPSRLC